TCARETTSATTRRQTRARPDLGPMALRRDIPQPHTHAMRTWRDHTQTSDLPRGALAGTVRTLLPWLGLVLLLSEPAIVAIAHWHYTGLFFWLGIDWAMFWAAARAFVSDGPVSVYDLE